MKIAPLATDVNRQVQANIGVRSTYGKPQDFSRYLKTGNEDARFAIQAPDDMEAPEIDEAARAIWGTAYDPATKAVRLDVFTRNTQAATEAFGRKLGGLLRSAGIDTNTPVELNVAGDGRVLAGSNDPRASAINQLFDENPVLANEYRKISSDNEMVAMGKLSTAYGQRWSAAKTDSQRSAVFNYYSSLFSHAKSLSGHMHFAMDMLTSQSLSYASKITKS